MVGIGAARDTALAVVVSALLRFVRTGACSTAHVVGAVLADVAKLLAFVAEGGLADVFLYRDEFVLDVYALMQQLVADFGAGNGDGYRGEGLVGGSLVYSSDPIHGRNCKWVETSTFFDFADAAGVLWIKACRAGDEFKYKFVSFVSYRSVRTEVGQKGVVSEHEGA